MDEAAQRRSVWTLITGDTPHGTVERRFRQVLGSFPTGVCLVTTMGADGKREGMTINSFASVSLTPPLILWSLRNSARSAANFLAAQRFIISVLGVDQQALAEHFARSSADKFAAFEDAFERAGDDCPRLRHAVATFECETASRVAQGDHTLIVGRVTSFSGSDDPPLLFHAGRMGSAQVIADAIDGA